MVAAMGGRKSTRATTTCSTCLSRALREECGGRDRQRIIDGNGSETEHASKLNCSQLTEGGCSYLNAVLIVG